jgi:hypothetical protein
MFRETNMNPPSIRTRFRNTLVAAACFSALGCSNDPVNIGDGNQEIDKSNLESYAALWDGYVEAHEFRSGSDRVRVSIDESGAGFLQVGDGDALPLPTDPSVGWPPTGATSAEFYVSASLYEGVLYPLGNVRIESERLRFQLQTNDAFAPFCELQAPVEQSPGQYGCFPYNGWSPTEHGGCAVILEPGGDDVLVDCAKLFICFDACVCDAMSCTGRPGLDVPIDAALDDDGDDLVGTIILQDEGVGPRTIRLRRQ